MKRLAILAALALPACSTLVGQGSSVDAGRLSDADDATARDASPGADVGTAPDAPAARAACLGAPLGTPGDVLPAAPGWTSVAALPAGAAARAMLFDDRGGLFVGAYAQFPGARGSYDALFLRFEPGLTLDRSFGDNGRLQVDAVAERPGVDVITDAEVDAAGRLVFAGWNAVAGGADNRGVAIRFLPSGALDPDFGRGGVATVAAAGGFSPYALHVDDRGVVLAGTTIDNYLGVVGVAARLDDRGALDPAFGDRGLLTVPNSLALRDLVADGDGYLALTGDPDRLQPALLRLRRDGSVDTTFGLAGRAAHPRAWDVIPAALRRLPDGRLLAAGAYVPIHNAATGLQTLMRFEADGRADLGYGRDGLVEERAGATSFVTSSPFLAVQCDGSVLTTTIASGSSAMVHRFTPDGLPDPTFGRDGRVVLPRLAVPTFGQALRVAPDQRSVLVLSIASDGRLGVHRLAL